MKTDKQEFDINLYDFCLKETTINTCPMKPNRIENNKDKVFIYFELLEI